MYSPPRFYYVYIMTNCSKTLHTGVTGYLERRVLEHKQGIEGEFAAYYKIDRLVYFERFGDIHAAVGREKQIKGLLRMKKIALIVSVNPAWKDLSEEWYIRHRYQPETHRSFVGSSSRSEELPPQDDKTTGITFPLTSPPDILPAPASACRF